MKWPFFLISMPEAFCFSGETICFVHQYEFWCQLGASNPTPNYSFWGGSNNWELKTQIQLSVYSVYLLFRLKLGMMKDEMESEGYDDAIKDTMSDYYKMVSDSQSQKSVQSSSTSEWRQWKWYNQQGRRRFYDCLAALLAVKFQTHPICSNPIFLEWLYH